MTSRLMRRAIVLAGPTGVGKTALALELAKLLNGELISCDSVQVYRHLEIGANKERLPEAIPQHLIDFVDLDTPFTAADFYDKCFETMEDILSRKKVPILVGGTGFYLDWLVRGRPSAPHTDPDTMKLVNEEVDALLSWQDKIALLRSVDPEYAERLLDNDVYRLKRALTVYRQTGRPLSSFPKSWPKEWDWRCFYLTMDREPLNRNIDLRCEKMIEKGLIQETKGLLESGLLKKDSTAGRSIGYQESIAFLEGARTSKSFLEYLKNFQAVTRQYSRRQETWFRRMPEFKWIERPSFSRYPQSFVDRIVDWFKMDKDDFEESVSATDAEVRAKISKDQKSNIKRMKTYVTENAIYTDDVKIQSLLANLTKSDQQHVEEQ